MSEKENKRTGEMEPAPYALTPASADPVNDRIVFGDLPDDVDALRPRTQLLFVTVTAPNQSALSWLAGRDDPAVEFLTDGGQVRRPHAQPAPRVQPADDAHRRAGGAVRGADQARVTTSRSPPGDVIVQDVLCKVPSDDGDECEEWFPSDELIDPADRIIEADGVRLESVDDLSAVLADQAARRRDRPAHRASRRR